MQWRLGCGDSKDRDYLLVADVAMPADLHPARGTLWTLVMPGQRHLHMAKERDQPATPNYRRHHGLRRHRL